MKKVTVERIIKWKPCGHYTREYIKRLFGNRKMLTAQDIADLDISIEDRLWVLCNMLNKKQQRLLACTYTSAIFRKEREAGIEPDKRSVKVVKIAQAYARGSATKKQLEEACNAAQNAIHNRDYNSADVAVAVGQLERGIPPLQWTINRMARVTAQKGGDLFRDELEKLMKSLVKDINNQEKIK